MAALLRCAIYTRKSSEEGLDQSFNSLHAQREACEAYVLSQIGEGWRALPAIYDDGGFSGGSMERPGLKQLLADIAQGRIDVVVVYKVDRLTRSLTDFARIVEAFDAKGVSFVSVTQAFNTTTSMGRLTLNVLLSFAQFEREVTGERIRDKIAASKKKGMWMGGNPPLGYDKPSDPLTRALVVNGEEAHRVTQIFERYLALGSVHALCEALRREGATTKVIVSAKGASRGGVAFSRGAVFALLKNRVYLGEIVHRGVTAAVGAHPPIITPELFDQVQKLMAGHAHRHTDRRTCVTTMPLKGLTFDAEGAPMSPVYSKRREGRVYRYYVSTSRLTGLPETDHDVVRRVPADKIETLATSLVARLTKDPGSPLRPALRRIEVHPEHLQILLYKSHLLKRCGDLAADLKTLSQRLIPGEQLAAEIGDLELIRVIVPCSLRAQNGRVWVSDHNGQILDRAPRADATLIRGLQAGHRLVATAGDSRVGRPELVSFQKSLPSPYFRALMRLSFLAPDLQAMILEGRQPATLSLARLLVGDMPIFWEDQRRMLGIV